MSIRHRLFLSAIFALTTCAAGQLQKAEKLARQKDCEGSMSAFLTASTVKRVEETTKSTAGTTGSVIAGGTVAVTETVLYVGGGMALAVLICTPIAVIEAAAKSNGRASAECFVRTTAEAAALLVEEKGYSLTKTAWRKLAPLRVESYDDVSRVMRTIAACHALRNTAEDVKIARRQLRNFKNESGLWERISPAEKADFLELEQELLKVTDYR